MDIWLVLMKRQVSVPVAFMKVYGISHFTSFLKVKNVHEITQSNWAALWTSEQSSGDT
jgi:hypothetical protein